MGREKSDKLLTLRRNVEVRSPQGRKPPRRQFCCYFILLQKHAYITREHMNNGEVMDGHGGTIEAAAAQSLNSASGRKVFVSRSLFLQI